MGKILIVDDSSTIRKTLHAVLEGYGWEVFEAENGLEGVNVAQQIRPDLIIMDLSMPVMNGFEAFKKIKVLMPSVLIVMFSNFLTVDLIAECHKAGLDDCVEKSSGAMPLIHTINKMLEKHAIKGCPTLLTES